MKLRRQAERTILLTDLKSCTTRRDLKLGRRIHAKAIDTRHDSDTNVTTALVKMYGRCRSMVDARRVFDSIDKPDLVTWNVLLQGYTENGKGLVTLDLFSRMKACGYATDSVSYVASVKACTSLAKYGGSSGKEDCLKRGRKLHLEIGSQLDPYLQGALIEMYAKCGSLEDARCVFNNMKFPDVVAFTALILGYAENGQGLVALGLVSDMKLRGCTASSSTYVAALKACIALAANGDKILCLERGREIHSEIDSHLLNHYVQATLIDMYSKCGSMVDARRVFDDIQKSDVVSWNVLLLGYAENGEGGVTLDLFSKMRDRGCAPNPVSYVASLKACTSLIDVSGKEDCLRRGREIHSHIGCNLDHYVQATLIDMYAKSGSMPEARRVFDSIHCPNVVSWTALLLGYAENGKGLVSLDLFFKMKESGCVPNSVTYVAAIKACTSLAINEDGKRVCLKRGKEIHLEIGCHLDHNVQGTLVDMYSTCGSMVEARQVFDMIEKPDVVSWNVLLLGYVENGEGHVALEQFSAMKASGCAPNSVTYLAVLKACGLIGDVALGRKFHSEISEFTGFVVTCLVDFYAKWGTILEAREVFDHHPRTRIVATWNALLAGYGTFGDSDSVFNLFEAMKDEGFRPDAVTFVCLLLCCCHAGMVEKARDYFQEMTVQYKVNPTIQHYTCMVDVLGRANQLSEAIAMLRIMPCNPDAVIWMALLGACHKWKNIQIGRLAYRSLVGMDKVKEDAPAHVLMSQIYGSSDMSEEQLETSKLHCPEVEFKFQHLSDTKLTKLCFKY